MDIIAKLSKIAVFSPTLPQLIFPRAPQNNHTRDPSVVIFMLMKPKSTDCLTHMQ